MYQTSIHRITAQVKRWLLLAAFGLGCWAIQAEAVVLTVTKETRQINPVQTVEIYKDATGTLGLQDILQPRMQAMFTPARPDLTGDINFGFTEATYWVKLTLQRTPTAPEFWILEIPYLNLNKITFYRPGQPVIHVGTDVSSDNKPIFYPLYALPLQLSTQPQTYYLQVSSQYALTVPLILWDPTAFSHEFSNKLMTQALYFGGLLSLAIYNFLLFLSLKDRSHLYYTLFAITLILGMFAGNGYGRIYLWPNAKVWDTISQTTFFSLAGALSLWFTTSFLNTPKYTPSLHRWLNGFAISYCLTAAALVASMIWGFSSTPALKVALLIALPGTLCALYAGIRVYRHNNRSALYFLLACCALWLGAIIAGLRAFDLVPSNAVTLHALQIGSAIEMLLLSFALAQRIHSEREQRILAQGTALEAQNSLLVLAKETEARLESKVVERTELLQEIALKEKETRHQYVRFGAMIAHEFRNPLGIIETQTALLQREQQLGINKVEDRTDTILSASHRLVALFDQWLTRDQLQEPISHVHIETINLESLMATVIHTARSFHRDRQIHSEATPNTQLQGDQGLLEIALLNLIDNACKYSPATEAVCIRFQHRENQIGITVTDHGPGLPPGLQQEIFKAYVRTGDTNARPGFGLGLAFVAHIAEVHHGDITVTSQPEQGSEFCLWIPCI